MAWSIKRELARKGLHLLTLVFLFVYIIFATHFSHKKALLILAFLLVVLLEMEYFRVELKTKIFFLHKLHRRFRRKKEEHNIGGEVFFLMGSIVALAAFDVRVAVCAMLMTTFGDLTAALVGKQFGKHKIPWLKKRAWEGVIAQFVVNFIIGFFILRTTTPVGIWWLHGGGFNGEAIWLVIFVMALVATIVESVTDKLDDNLLIPVFSGFFGHLTLLFLGLTVL